VEEAAAIRRGLAPGSVGGESAVARRLRKPNAAAVCHDVPEGVEERRLQRRKVKQAVLAARRKARGFWASNE
jgi:hypothetical protein